MKNFTIYLRYSLVLVALSYILVYVIFAFLRMQYPFELEWLESGSLDQLKRLLSGQKLYVAPSLDYVPFIYTPLFYWISALFGLVMGPSFAPLRLVSLLASVGCFGLIFLFVKKETANTWLAVMSAGLFAATYKLTEEWFDLARVDTLALFFILAAIYFLRFNFSGWGLILAGGLATAAYLTKQTALPVFFPLILYSLYVNWRRSLYFIFTLGGLILASILTLDALDNGWFSYYTLTLPKQHSIGTFSLDFWFRDLLRPLAIVCGVSIFYLVSQIKASAKKDYLFYVAAGLGMVGQSWAAQLNQGSSSNVSLPAYAILAILFGLGLQQMLGFIEASPAGKLYFRKFIFLMVCLVQFIILAYNPFNNVPPQRDVDAGRGLITTISQQPGEVLMPSFCYIVRAAGKNSDCFHIVAFEELLGGFGGDITPYGAQLSATIKKSIEEKRYSAILVGNMPFPWRDELEQYYTIQRSLFDDNETFLTYSAMPVRPEFIYVPK